MFTGIVTDVGLVRRIEKRGDTHIAITTQYDVSQIDIGASIACSGACMTVTEKGDAADRWFAFSASAESLAHTNMAGWTVGQAINLERALKLGDEMGGHIVTGHVDGVAEILEMIPEGESLRVRFEVPAALAGFIAPKGSVALDGVSLTVNAVEDRRFGVNIIPHTSKVTALNAWTVGGRVNLEVDLMARYVARLVNSQLVSK